MISRLFLQHAEARILKMAYLNEIQLGNFIVGQLSLPLLVAELSGNHNQSYERAIQLINTAKKSGAQAIKIQTFTPDSITLNVRTGPFYIDNPKSLWYGKTLHEIYKIAQTPWEWHEPLFQYCQSQGLLCFSSPFDQSAIDFLESINCPCYKVASSENTDHLILKRVAETKKPVIVSTGHATLSELSESIELLRKNGCNDIVLLKCTAAYPAPPNEINLKTLPNLREIFNCQVGLSDHTLGMGVAIASVAFGATIIEKHSTLSREEGGVDAAFSMEPEEFSQMAKNIKIAWESIGNISYGATQNEDAKRGRRSLYFSKKMMAGEVVTRECVKSVRPGFGLPTKYLDVIQGMKLAHSVNYGDPVQWDCFKPCHTSMDSLHEVAL